LVTFVLTLINIPIVGSDAWVFHPPEVDARGLLAPVARAARGEWDLGLMRAAALSGALLLMLAATIVTVRGSVRVLTLALILVVGACAVVAPPVVEQAALRDATAPWFYTNDSTFQAELAGSRMLHGKNPYGYDYGHTGLARWYSFDGSPPPPGARIAQLKHFPYYPGTAFFGALSQMLPSPVDDLRFLLALATLALIPAALLLPGPLVVRLSVGLFLALNPLAVRMAWFATNDAPCLLALLIAFGFAFRRRAVPSAIALGVAILMKQFAIAAVPFLFLLQVQTSGLRSLTRPALALAVTVVVGTAPFIIADPYAFWNDTFRFGTTEYRLIGYGLAGLLVRFGIVARAADDYPFSMLVVAVWAPITAGLMWVQYRARTTQACALGFSASVFVLIFIARVFQVHYVAYPLLGCAIAVAAVVGGYVETDVWNGPSTAHLAKRRVREVS
jgi:hypothetical protein